MRSLHSLGTSLLLVTLAAACGADTTDINDSVESSQTDVDGKADSTGRWTYYTVRHDLRRCVSPLCGGYYVARANQAYTRCSDGTYHAECYVASVDNSAVGVDISAGMVLRGRVRAKSYGTFGNLGELVASEAWSPATGGDPSGIFYRAYDNGIRCIKAPCPSLSEGKLNSYNAARNITAVDFDGVGAPADAVDAAWNALGGNDGVLVAGGNSRKSGALVLEATQFYVRATPAAKCYVGGCSSEVCSDKDGVITTCLWRPEFACYQQFGVCERQGNGSCGWTATPDLDACLAK